MDKVRIDVFGKLSMVGAAMPEYRSMQVVVALLLSRHGETIGRLEMAATLLRGTTEADLKNLKHRLSRVRRCFVAGFNEDGTGHVSLDTSVVSSDVWEMEDAIQAATASRKGDGVQAHLIESLRKYRPIAPELGQAGWLTRWRARMRFRFLRSLEALEWDDALALLQNAADFDGLEWYGRTFAAIARANALCRTGDYDAALHVLRSDRVGGGRVRSALRIVSDRIARRESADRRDPDPATAPILQRERRLVGHEANASQAAWLVSHNRLVTLRGAPGVGKSQLAAQVAYLLQANFGKSPMGRKLDGAAYIDLSDLAAETSLAQAENEVALRVCARLGIRESPKFQPVDTVARALARVRMLLVLDNAEHVTHQCRVLVKALAGCPGVHTLVTSRRTLGHPSERVFHLGPLAVPDTGDYKDRDRFFENPTVSLMLMRSEIAPNDVASIADARLLDGLCRASDGLPLAIEIIAAQVRQHGVGEAHRLWHSHAAGLKAGTADVEHHGTLERAVDWSYSLLTVHEAAVFRRLSVITGEWELPMARAVYAFDRIDEDDIAFLVSELANDSLLAKTGRGEHSRYRMLVPVRVVADLRAEEHGAERATARRNLVQYVTELAAKKDGEDEPARWARLEANLGHVESAVRYSVASESPWPALTLGERLWLFLRAKGHVAQGREWLRLIDTRSAEALAILVSAGEAPDEAPGHALALGGSLFGLGDLSERAGDPAAALRCYRRARRAFGLGGLEGGRIGTMNAIATIRTNESKFRLARRLFGVSLRLAGRTTNPRNMSVAFNNLARVELLDGNLSGAEELFEKALAINESMSDAPLAAASWDNLGAVAYFQGDYRKAQAHWLRSLEMHDQAGNEIDRVLALTNLGCASTALGELDAARRHLSEAAKLNETVEHESGGAGIAYSFGLLEERSGNLPEALSRLAGAAGRYLDLRQPIRIVEALEVFVRVALCCDLGGSAAAIWYAVQAERNRRRYFYRMIDLPDPADIDALLIQMQQLSDAEGGVSAADPLSLEEAVALAAKVASMEYAGSARHL